MALSNRNNLSSDEDSECLSSRSDRSSIGNFECDDNTPSPQSRFLDITPIRTRGSESISPPSEDPYQGLERALKNCPGLEDQERGLLSLIIRMKASKFDDNVAIPYRSLVVEELLKKNPELSDRVVEWSMMFKGTLYLPVPPLKKIIRRLTPNLLECFNPSIPTRQLITLHVNELGNGSPPQKGPLINRILNDISINQQQPAPPPPNSRSQKSSLSPSLILAKDKTTTCNSCFLSPTKIISEI